MHPCHDHPCDHCHSCEVLGVCCASSRTTAQSLGSVDSAQADGLRQAMLADQVHQASLSELLHVEALEATLRRMLRDENGLRPTKHARHLLAHADGTRLLRAPPQLYPRHMNRSQISSGR